MSILADIEIKQLCLPNVPQTDSGKLNWNPMITPFESGQVKKHLQTSDDSEIMVSKDCISYGLSSFGYDLRVANEFKIFTNVNSTVIDPKNFNDKTFVDFVGDVCVIPPNSFVLARSVEKFAIPRDISAIVLGKSTYARCGISCLATPLEAGWEGYVTLEFANTTPLPAMLYANEGAAQVVFFRGNVACEISYDDRSGKYQHQGPQVTLPRA